MQQCSDRSFNGLPVNLNSHRYMGAESEYQVYHISIMASRPASFLLAAAIVIGL
jgi:hypothetical protein